MKLVARWAQVAASEVRICQVRAPSWVLLPQEILRAITAGRSWRSARLLVASTPSRRVVTQQIRAIQVQLRAPRRTDRLRSAVQIWVVQAKEIDPPADQEPIEWTLITSLEAKDFDQACAVLDLYLCRWEIEVYHRVLKTGCRVTRTAVAYQPAGKVSHPAL